MHTPTISTRSNKVAVYLKQNALFTQIKNNFNNQQGRVYDRCIILYIDVCQYKKPRVLIYTGDMSIW